MIKKLALGILLVGIAAVIQNAGAAPITFLGNGYVILNINGAGNVFYNLNNPGDTTNPLYDTNDSSGAAFSQTFNISPGQSILLGGEEQTFPQQGGTSAFLGYRITDLTETTGSFTELNLPFLDQVGNNDRWQQLPSVEIGSSLAPGNYLLEVFQHASNGDDNTFTQEGAANNNWEAQIVVVPEPSTLSLLAGPMLLGGWFFIRRRRAS